MAESRAAQRQGGDDIRRIFRERAERFLDRLSRTAPRGVLERAIAQPSDYGSLAFLLADDRAVAPEYRALDPFARMRARAEGLKAALAERAGGLAPASEIAAETRVTRQALSKAAGEGRLIAIRTSGGLLFPRCQFHEGRLIQGLSAVLRALRVTDPWTRLSFLLSANARLGGRSPLETLRDGRVEEAVAAAEGFGAHGG